MLLPQSYHKNALLGGRRWHRQAWPPAVPGQLRQWRSTEYPFSGVTSSGRVWRTVPESDARSAFGHWVALKQGRTWPHWTEPVRLHAAPSTPELLPEFSPRTLVKLLLLTNYVHFCWKFYFVYWYRRLGYQKTLILSCFDLTEVEYPWNFRFCIKIRSKGNGIRQSFFLIS